MSSITSSVRTRFAPSPTGLPHVGAMRSALFNYLWAKHSGGTFVLRLEDTDQARLVEGAAEQISASLEALGITPDEGPRQGGHFGPYTQSERLKLYREHADELKKTGHLYRCWCSPERLTKLRETAAKAGKAFKYDRHCLDPRNHKSDHDPFVLRFRVPDSPETVSWNDAVRGKNEVRTDTLDDFVALKSDGFPTYHFASVIDDHQMAISHVLRADEWLPSTPKHLLLFAAFEWNAPVYAHLPAVLGPSGGKKLSKRDGAQSVQEYLDEGYLPEALMSFLATLGWNDGTTQEVYDPEELIAKFTLDRIQKSPAKFDKERLTWVNGVTIRKMPSGQLLRRADRFWPTGAAEADEEFKEAVLKLVQERLKFLSELPELTDFFFVDLTPPRELLTKSLPEDKAKTALDTVVNALSGTLVGNDWSPATLEAVVRPLAEQLGLKTGDLFGLLRVALTSRTAAPGLFDTMSVLGHDTTVRRLQAAQALFNR